MKLVNGLVFVLEVVVVVVVEDCCGCWLDDCGRWEVVGEQVICDLVRLTSSARSRFSLQVLVGMLAVDRMDLRCLSLYFIRSSVVVCGRQMIWQIRQTRSFVVVGVVMDEVI